MTSQTRIFVPVTGSAKGIDAAGCWALTDTSNGMAQAFARRAFAECIGDNAINQGLIDVPIPRFSRASTSAEKGTSAVPLRRFSP